MPSRAYKGYVLTILTLVYTLNGLDAPLLILSLQSIKNEFQLSDTQLGFLTGIAFGLFYATLGLPIARWADRGNRVTITSLAIGLWSITVMLCLFVNNFIQLVVARVAAGIGESGCMPPTYSLVGDYFPKPAERTRAMAIYMMSAPLSGLVSFALGGWLNERYGWRVAFFVIGIPGILFAVLVKMTIHEPRTCAIPERKTARQLPRTADVLVMLWRQPSSRHMIAAIILFFTTGLGLSPWIAAFMIRSHGVTMAELGVWLGLISGAGGMVGVLLGGYVAERWFAGDERRQMRLIALVIALLVPCYILILFLPQKEQSLMAITPLTVACAFIFGPAFALMQRLVVDEMRATTMALVMLLANLIGMGIGPQLVGILSDSLKPLLGAESLRYAMLTIVFLALWSAYHFWQVGKTIMSDLSAIADRMKPSADEFSLPITGSTPFSETPVSNCD